MIQPEFSACRKRSIVLCALTKWRNPFSQNGPYGFLNFAANAATLEMTDTNSPGKSQSLIQFQIEQ